MVPKKKKKITRKTKQKKNKIRLYNTDGKKITSKADYHI